MEALLEAHLGKVSHTELGLDNHQMAVEDLVGGRADGLDNERSNCDIGDEPAIHDVDVDPIAASSIDSLDLSD